jgi:epoxyqueuosine reductase
MFGCDVCQDVCPWNRFSVLHHEDAFKAHEELLNMQQNEWKEITEEVFQKIFKNSPVKRTKFIGLKRNIEFLHNSD